MAQRSVIVGDYFLIYFLTFFHSFGLSLLENIYLAFSVYDRTYSSRKLPSFIISSSPRKL